MNKQTQAPPAQPGKIITFYSYKGGTGRTMALANAAWILASNGNRVIVIDWDLEAPGLHRYFRPFLPDPELSETPGLIDFFFNFLEAAQLLPRSAEKTSPSDPPWFYERADLLRYSTPLDYEFPKEGRLDIVGAGQQGPSYGARVNSYQWGEFYEKLGGGTFLEAVKQQLREQYDYILIDSRTGLSDTSGICTVQMPDELVVCFTLNRQSMWGAAATAYSADSQRRLPTGEQGLRIWPVPTRVELHEKDRLEAARVLARERFAQFLWHVPASQRADYWGAIEILYFPYYAYEEILATIADPPGQTNSLLRSMEQLTTRIWGKTAISMPKLPSGDREKLLSRCRETPAAPALSNKKVFLSYAKADQAVVNKLAHALTRELGPKSVFWDEMVPLGADWDDALKAGLNSADTILVAAGPNWKNSKGSREEVKSAIAQGKVVVPVLINGASFDALPPELRKRRAATLSPGSFDEDLMRFVGELKTSLPSSKPKLPPIDPDDPHKGQFGGLSKCADREVTANVSTDKSWFGVELRVKALKPGRPLEGVVEFHLHPTFRPSLEKVSASNGAATLSLTAWGAFTVGVVADAGATRLELDLAQLKSAPKVFRER